MTNHIAIHALKNYLVKMHEKLKEKQLSRFNKKKILKKHIYTPCRMYEK